MRFAAGAIVLLLSAASALPVANPKAHPEASPDTAAGHTEYGDYGKYTNYPRDSGVAQYDDYGTYKRDENKNYGGYGKYTDYPSN